MQRGVLIIIHGLGKLALTSGLDLIVEVDPNTYWPGLILTKAVSNLRNTGANMFVFNFQIMVTRGTQQSTAFSRSSMTWERE